MKSDVPWPDSEYIKLRGKVRSYFKKWILILGLRYWQCDLEYRRIPFEEKNVIARCYCKWQYRQLTLEISLLELRDWDNEKIEKMVIHELCHALVNEMQEADPDGKHEESVVSGLTSAFWWTWEGGVSHGNRRKSVRRA